jgi:hypothetical protein
MPSYKPGRKLPLSARIGLPFAALAVASGGCASERPLEAERLELGIHSVLAENSRINALPVDCRQSIVMNLGIAGCESVQSGELEAARAARSNLAKLVGSTRITNTLNAAEQVDAIKPECADALIGNIASEQLDAVCAGVSPSRLDTTRDGLNVIETSLQQKARDAENANNFKMAIFTVGGVAVISVCAYVGVGLWQLSAEG